MSTSPRFVMLNFTNVYEEEISFKSRLSNAFVEMANKTRDNDEKYLRGLFVLNGNQTLYVLNQCTQDLSSGDCIGCLYDMIIGSAIPWSRLGSVGGRVLLS